MRWQRLLVFFVFLLLILLGFYFGVLRISEAGVSVAAVGPGRERRSAGTSAEVPGTRRSDQLVCDHHRIHRLPLAPMRGHGIAVVQVLVRRRQRPTVLRGARRARPRATPD
jgi:hypothetical protein